jgi:hypothetical protein
MRVAAWLSLLALSACGPTAQELSVRVPAPTAALACVEQAAAEFGYAIDPRGPADRLRVERQIAWTQHTPFHRWNRIEAHLRQGGELQLDAGTLERHATRELTGRLVAPEAKLQSELQAIQSRCTVQPA